VYRLFEDSLQDGGATRRGKDVAHQLLHMWGREARHTRYGRYDSNPLSRYGVCMSMWVAIGCKRVLKRDAYMVHEGDPFCQACYWENNRLFKPQGEAGGRLLCHNSTLIHINGDVCLRVCMCIYKDLLKFMEVPNIHSIIFTMYVYLVYVV
jgi:hypothetical protein